MGITILLKMSLVASIILLLNLEWSSAQSQPEKPQKGENICRDNACKCRFTNTTIYVNCKRLGLSGIYTDKDLLTLEELVKGNRNKLVLYFDGNQIQHIPKFPSMSIVKLTFKNNKINSIEDTAFTNLHMLKSLDLSHNNLNGNHLKRNTLARAFDPVRKNFPPLNLTQLDLSYNAFTSISKEALDKLPRLEILDLSNNPLSFIHHNYTGKAINLLTNLKQLNLSYTGVRSISTGMLNPLNQLTTLDLSGNLFRVVHKEIKNAKSLVDLHFADNKLTTLHNETFQGLGHLRRINLRNNEELESIEFGAFTPLINLEALDISFSSLVKISDDAFYGVVPASWKLKEIRLNDNSLTEISQDLLPWEKVSYLDISNNPFCCNCTCSLQLQKIVNKFRAGNRTLIHNIGCLNICGNGSTKTIYPPYNTTGINSGNWNIGHSGAFTRLCGAFYVIVVYFYAIVEAHHFI